MKKVNFNIILAVIILIFSGCGKQEVAPANNDNPDNHDSAQIQGYELIAHYPLTSDAKEASGNNNEFDCINVQYSSQGVYLNGIYGYDDNGSKAEVRVSGFNPDDFIIEFEYYAEEDYKPVFVGGNSYRWLYLYTQNGELRLDVLMENGYLESKKLEASTPLNTMRKIKIQYKKADNYSVKIYINDAEILSYNLPAALDAHNDLIFCSNHYGYGWNFKGYWRNMKFYKAKVNM